MKESSKDNNKVNKINKMKYFLTGTAAWTCYLSIIIGLFYVILSSLNLIGVREDLGSSTLFILYIIVYGWLIIAAALTLTKRINFYAWIFFALMIGSFVTIFSYNYPFTILFIFNLFLALFASFGRVVPMVPFNVSKSDKEKVNTDIKTPNQPVSTTTVSTILNTIEPSKEEKKQFEIQMEEYKLDNKTLIELKTLAQEKGLENFEKMTREQLILALKIIH